MPISILTLSDHLDFQTAHAFLPHGKTITEEWTDVEAGSSRLFAPCKRLQRDPQDKHLAYLMLWDIYFCTFPDVREVAKKFQAFRETLESRCWYPEGDTYPGYDEDQDISHLCSFRPDGSQIMTIQGDQHGPISAAAAIAHLVHCDHTCEKIDYTIHFLERIRDQYAVQYHV